MLNFKKILFISIIFFFACDEELLFDNPCDINGPQYICEDGSLACSEEDCDGYCEEASITVLAPNANEQLAVGETYTIQWDACLTPYINIELWNSTALLTTIATNITDTGSYSWEVETNYGINGNDGFAIRIIDSNDSNVWGWSDTFSIYVGEHYINITNPLPGDEFEQGDIVTITWDDDLPDDAWVMLRLLEMGIEPGFPIDIGSENNGFYDWEIPFGEHLLGEYFTLRVEGFYPYTDTHDQVSYITITAPESSPETINILYDSSVGVSAFQFNLEGVESVSGGATADWNISVNQETNTVIGFTLNNDIIPAGSGTLIVVTISDSNNEGTPCLSNVAISDDIGNPAQATVEDCTTIMITSP